MIQDPHTHPLRETLGANEVSLEAWALANEIRDIIRPEEAYAVAQRYLDAAANPKDSVVYDLEQKIIRLEARLHE